MNSNEHLDPEKNAYQPNMERLRAELAEFDLVLQAHNVSLVGSDLSSVELEERWQDIEEIIERELENDRIALDEYVDKELLKSFEDLTLSLNTESQDDFDYDIVLGTGSIIYQNTWSDGQTEVQVETILFGDTGAAADICMGDLNGHYDHSGHDLPMYHPNVPSIVTDKYCSAL